MICSHTLNQQYDIRKFVTLRNGVEKFADINSRRMQIEELQEYAKSQFPDKKFVDMLIKFVAERNPDTVDKNIVTNQPVNEHEMFDQEKKEPSFEKQYKIYVEVDKLGFLYDVLQNMPIIVSKDKNLSNQMGLVFSQPRTYDVASKVAAMGEEKSTTGSQINRHNPHLQKIMELIYVNIKKRFNIVSNAYCYLDFKARDGVSF